jgi:uncharacterized membrane protein YraQ (UPF0718 family)
MDIYAMVLLELIAAVLVTTIIGTIMAVVDNRKRFDAVVARNIAVAPLNTINYDDWQAKRLAANQRKQRVIAEFQALSELNNDFNAVIEGE